MPPDQSHDILEILKDRVMKDRRTGGMLDGGLGFAEEWGRAHGSGGIRSYAFRPPVRHALSSPFMAMWSSLGAVRCGWHRSRPAAPGRASAKAWPVPPCHAWSRPGNWPESVAEDSFSNAATGLARREFVDAARVLFAPPAHAKGSLIAQSDNVITSSSGWAKLSDALSIAPTAPTCRIPKGW